MQKYALPPELCYISSQILINYVKLHQGTQKTTVLKVQAFLFYNKAPKLFIFLAKLPNKVSKKKSFNAYNYNTQIQLINLNT
jgi:hypothetical protein